MGRPDKPYTEHLTPGGMLRRKRQAKGLSLSEVAFRAGYTTCYLSSVENDKRRVTSDIKKQYADVLGVSRGDLEVPTAEVEVVNDVRHERVWPSDRSTCPLI